MADISIVDRETIETSGATSLADLLARLPGVEFSRNGGPQDDDRCVPAIGAESRFTAVYIDEVRIDSGPPARTLESIPLGFIDRIQCCAAASAVYGSAP